MTERLQDLPFHIEPDAWVPVADLLKKFHPFNSQVRWEPEKEAIAQSIQDYGFVGESIIVNPWNDKIVSGHGRVEVCADRGFTGNLPVVYLRLEGEDEHRRAMLQFNRARGHQDPELVRREVTLLVNQLGRERTAVELGVMDDELANLLGEVGNPDFLGIDKASQPAHRNHPVDAIFTWNSGSGECCVAVRAGFKFGIQSRSNTVNAICTEHDQPPHKVVFVDNDYFQYDQALHVRIVELFRPKYATVRDIMTQAQCQAAKIAYYPLDQILDWAAEIEQYAENVILIPKYDCMDKIPERHMLGYSVPTSHGGTPLSVDLFRGRRVHLLGGSWKAQLAHLAALGDDVVSIDNNYIQKTANYGQFCYPDGRMGSAADFIGGDPWLTNPREVAFALSVGAVSTKVNELFPGSMTPLPFFSQPED